MNHDMGRDTDRELGLPVPSDRRPEALGAAPTLTAALDARQRAMLAEMGVRVWAPAAPAAGPAGAIDPGARPLADSGAMTAGPGAESATRSTPTPAPVPASAQKPATASTPPTATIAARPLTPAPMREAQPAAPAGRVGGGATGDAAADATLSARARHVATLDWPALADSVSTCQACGLCAGRQHTVFGAGDPKARWLVVGEAPGEHEDQQGQPFVGQAGKLLDNMLASLGLNRQGSGDAGVYIANVLKCRPPGNRNPAPEEVAQCEPYLRRQVALLQPRIILALGRFAVQSLLQAEHADVAGAPLGRLRGQVYRYQGVPVVVSYHPAYLLRNLPDKAKAWADLCLARQVLQTQAAQGAPGVAP